MNVFAHVEDRVAAALEALKQDGVLPADLVVPAVEVETPRDSTHGDLSTNAALVLAKPARMKPRDIAARLKEKLSGESDVAQIEVAGPGFLNLTFTPGFWQDVVRTIVEEGANYGRAAIGGGETINVEYVSANPTGPMHVGHCRGAVFGDALCNILEFTGYKVTREYYVN
ncbi:MAG: arginine--tRNA ligase, partial [Hyphomicrobium sp.]